MAKSTTPYNVSVTETERRRSGDSSNSELSTLYQFPSISSTNSSNASEYGHSRSYRSNASPVYSATVESDEIETSRRIEEEQRMRIRDYAIEISRLMGRQLVNGMKGGSGKKSHNAAIDGPKH